VVATRAGRQGVSAVDGSAQGRTEARAGPMHARVLQNSPRCVHQLIVALKRFSGSRHTANHTS
jgi:hypothetical protein